MSDSVSSTPARIALGGLTTLALSPLVYLNYRSQARLDELVTQGQAITGQISGKNCGNHGTVFYEYVVGGRKYSGSGTCSASCNNAQIGDPVSLIYATTDPSNSECLSLTSKHEVIIGNYYMIIVIAIALAVVIYRVTSVKDHGS